MEYFEIKKFEEKRFIKKVNLTTNCIVNMGNNENIYNQLEILRRYANR